MVVLNVFGYVALFAGILIFLILLSSLSADWAHTIGKRLSVCILEYSQNRQNTHQCNDRSLPRK